jgi:hypothetical protein
MRAGLRPRWIILLAAMAIVVAGVLTPWLEGMAAAQARVEASEAPPPCESPAMRGMGCTDRTVCIAKSQQLAALTVGPATMVGADIAGLPPTASPGAALLAFGPQPPPPRT